MGNWGSGEVISSCLRGMEIRCESIDQLFDLFVCLGRVVHDRWQWSIEGLSFFFPFGSENERSKERSRERERVQERERERLKGGTKRGSETFPPSRSVSKILRRDESYLKTQTADQRNYSHFPSSSLRRTLETPRTPIYPRLFYPSL